VEDLRRSRQEVQRAERLGTLGTLAAGLAHEINNPLVSIHTFLSLAPGKRFDEDSEFWGAYHDLARREVERIRGLVATMSRLGRGGADPAQRASCDLGELAGEVVTLLAREARRRDVELDARRHPVTPRVWGVREQLQQVVLNLVLNALQATASGGRVAVRTLGDPSGEGAWLEVTDSGAGIPGEELEKIFDPFFTTKDPDQGTGLGLTICHGIVSEHGGTIEVESERGAGTTFRVRLPARADVTGLPPAPDDPLGA
jgi:signal transduction histidine kinase